MKTASSFDDVLLVPNYSDIRSRSEVDLTSVLREEEYDEDTNKKVQQVSLSLPIISSPMDTVTGKSMASAMAASGGLGILHRYCTIEQQVDMLPQGTNFPSAAIGVTGDFFERAQELVDHDCKVLCIDVAHGHHISVKAALTRLKKRFDDRIVLIAGNVATAKAYEDLSNWGADAVRVGIGGGSICSTRIQTGHGVPTLQSIMDCVNSEGHAFIIADGGIKNSGDIVKCYAAGADFVMLGSLLAGTKEAPGETFNSSDGKKYKVYRGMASVEAQVDWRGQARSLEGVSTTVPYKGPVKKILQDLQQNIRSGLSYSGAKNLKQFYNKSTFINQTGAGMLESSTHILAR